jgi:hypothetical protein
VGFLAGVKFELIKHKCEPKENPSYGEEESLFKKEHCSNKTQRKFPFFSCYRHPIGSYAGNTYRSILNSCLVSEGIHLSFFAS